MEHVTYGWANKLTVLREQNSRVWQQLTTSILTMLSSIQIQNIRCTHYCRGEGSGHRVQQIGRVNLHRGVGWRLEAILRLEAGDLTSRPSAGWGQTDHKRSRAKGVFFLSTPRGRKFMRKAIHPAKQGQAKIAVCTRLFCTRLLTALRQ